VPPARRWEDSEKAKRKEGKGGRQRGKRPLAGHGGRCLPSGSHHVRVALWVLDGDVLQLDVEELVHRVQRAADGQVVLHLHRHLLAHQGLEEGAEQHLPLVHAHTLLPAAKGASKQPEEKEGQMYASGGGILYRNSGCSGAVHAYKHYGDNERTRFASAADTAMESGLPCSAHARRCEACVPHTRAARRGRNRPMPRAHLSTTQGFPARILERDVAASC
jgi:hypothetical protein